MADGRSDSKRVTQRVSEGVPVCYRKAQVVGHRPALNDFEGFVVFESQRVLGARAFVWNLGDSGNAGFSFIMTD